MSRDGSKSEIRNDSMIPLSRKSQEESRIRFSVIHNPKRMPTPYPYVIQGLHPTRTDFIYFFENSGCFIELQNFWVFFSEMLRIHEF